MRILNYTLCFFAFFFAHDLVLAQSMQINQKENLSSLTDSTFKKNINRKNSKDSGESITYLTESKFKRDTIKNRLPDGVLLTTQDYEKWLNNNLINLIKER